MMLLKMPNNIFEQIQSTENDRPGTIEVGSWLGHGVERIQSTDD